MCIWKQCAFCNLGVWCFNTHTHTHTFVGLFSYFLIHSIKESKPWKWLLNIRTKLKVFHKLKKYSDYGKWSYIQAWKGMTWDHCFDKTHIHALQHFFFPGYNRPIHPTFSIGWRGSSLPDFHPVLPCCHWSPGSTSVTFSPRRKPQTSHECVCCLIYRPEGTKILFSITCNRRHWNTWIFQNKMASFTTIFTFCLVISFVFTF